MDISLKDLELIRDALIIASEEYRLFEKPQEVKVDLISDLTFAERNDRFCRSHNLLQNVQHKILLIKETQTISDL